MNITETLQELHRLYVKVRELRADAEQGPRRIKKFQAKIDHNQKQLADAQDVLKHMKVTIHEKEVTMKSNLEKIAKHQQQMNTASERKTYDALRREIDNEKQANRVLEDEILEVMGQIEEKAKVLPDLEKALALAKEEHRRAESDLAGRHTNVTEQRTQAEADLRRLEAAIPDEWKEKYLRLKNSKGGEPIAAVHGRSCEGCNTDVTNQQFNDLISNRAVMCKSCGCFLYLAGQPVA